MEDGTELARDKALHDQARTRTQTQTHTVHCPQATPPPPPPHHHGHTPLSHTQRALHSRMPRGSCSGSPLPTSPQVLLLLERVSEAQRHAAMEMRAGDSRGKGKGGGKGKRSAEGEAEDASAEPELQRMIDQQARRKQKKKR